MPIALLLIFGGVLLFRQIAVGRVGDIPGDARDFANALLAGDPATVGEVMQRRGTNVASGLGSDPDATFSPAGSTGETTPFDSAASSALLAEVMRLGNAASGYVWGATGPKTYDCSGIVWRACKNLGYYDGPRFTTSTFNLVAKTFCYAGEQLPETDPSDFVSIGNILVWPGKHMGVAMNGTKMYSAKSPSSGIGTSDWVKDSSYHGGMPMCYRLMTKDNPNVKTAASTPAAGIAGDTRNDLNR